MGFIMIMLIYELMGILFTYMYAPDAIAATAVADILTIIMAGCYLYDKQITRRRPKADIRSLPIGRLALCFIMLYVSSQVLAMYMYAVAGDPAFDLYTETEETGSSVILFILDLIVAPVCEELMFRGILYKNVLRKHCRPFMAAIISAVLFAAFHGTITHFIVIVPFGLFLCLIDEISGSILPGMISHIIFNGIGLFLPDTISVSIYMFEILILFIIYASVIVWLLYQLQKLSKRAVSVS